MFANALYIMLFRAIINYYVVNYDHLWRVIVIDIIRNLALHYFAYCFDRF